MRFRKAAPQKSGVAIVCYAEPGGGTDSNRKVWEPTKASFTRALSNPYWTSRFTLISPWNEEEKQLHMLEFSCGNVAKAINCRNAAGRRSRSSSGKPKTGMGCDDSDDVDCIECEKKPG